MNIPKSRFSGRDHRFRQSLVKANVQLAQVVRNKLSESSLGTPEELSSVAVDVADIVAIGERLRSKLRDLLKLRFPRDLEKLENLIVEFKIDLLWENQWHLNSLKQELPKLLRRLDRRLRGRETLRTSQTKLGSGMSNAGIDLNVCQRQAHCPGRQLRQ